MMLGFLLARAGIDVTVLEKHADFLRDFRGDTIHPSTLEVMHELGLLEDLLKLPHQKAESLAARFNDTVVTVGDFSHLPARCPFIAFMPQWDFLDFLVSRARNYPGFHLMMKTEATELIEEKSRVVGLRAQTSEGTVEIKADLVVGADGRHSTVRERARMPVVDLGAAFDVLWMRLSRRPDDPDQTLGNFRAGRTFVTINRGDYWQCGLVIAKGEWELIKQKGLEHFHDVLAELVPFSRDRLAELDDWNRVQLLTVQVNRLTHWHRAGLLCIGDAAHAMSPVGGVGINLAIQDAVAAANILAAPLREARLSEEQLALVEKRRRWPTIATQRLQLLIQERVLTRGPRPMAGPPLLARALGQFPLLRRLPARVIGIGFRPEHVQVPAASS
jgi:2-polyprenyl-6-methoxyphenol hydroxylase-like FAD-dependent oxidoreductase